MAFFWQTISSNTLSMKECHFIVICGPIDIKSSLMREMVRSPQNMNQRWATCCVTMFECVNRATRTRWMNYVPRKMPDVRSRYDRFTIAPIYVRMLRYMDECYGLFTTKNNHFHLERQKLRKMVTNRVVSSALFICNHFSLFSGKHE